MNASASCLLHFFHDQRVMVVVFFVRVLCCLNPPQLRETAREQKSLPVTGRLQVFEMITSSRHFWPGHPPFMQEVLNKILSIIVRSTVLFLRVYLTV